MDQPIQDSDGNHRMFLSLWLSHLTDNQDSDGNHRMFLSLWLSHLTDKSKTLKQSILEHWPLNSKKKKKNTCNHYSQNIF
jgi:hypothetical protein